MFIKKTTLLVGLAFTSFLATSQNIEHYKSILDTVQNKNLKLSALDSIIKYVGRKDDEAYANYTEMYVALASSLKRYDAAATKAIHSSYTINFILNNPDRSIKLLESLLPFEDSLGSSRLKGGVYSRLGDCYRNGKDLNIAIENYNKAIDGYSEKDSSQVASSYLFRGRAKLNSGDSFGGVEDYRKSYDYYEGLKNEEYMLYAQQGVIVAYSMNGFLEDSRKERLKLFEKTKDTLYNHIVLSEHYNQSLDYKKQNKQAEREIELKKALDLVSENTAYYYRILLFQELSEFYGGHNNIKASKKYLDLIETEINTMKQLDNRTKTHYLTAKSKYLNNVNKPKEALKLALEKKKIVLEFDYKEDIMHTDKLLSKIYENLGNNQSAIKHYKAYNHLKDSLFGVTKGNALVYYQTLYETEKKEKEIVEKTSEINLLEEKNTFKKKQIIFGGLGLSAFFGFVLLIRNRRHLKKSQVLQEKYTQDLLASQEEERKRVSKDLHDSIGQSLLLIKNKIVLNKDDGTKDIVDSAIEEVRSISRALHPFQLEELGITKAIETIISQTDETTELFISSEIDNLDDVFSKDKEVNIYRIVQESLNNIIKHAKAEAVRVDIIKKNNIMILTIKDNGVGFDFSERYNDFKSLGLKTLKERTKFLNGLMLVDSEKGKGTTLEFKIPIA